MARSGGNTSVTAALQRQIEHLETQLADALARNERLELETAEAVVRADELERELASERELRLSIEEALQDASFVPTLERMVARHSAAIQEERARLDERLRHERERHDARMDAATVRHEQAVINLVAAHRREVSERLDQVLRQNESLFARITGALQDIWAVQGTTRPSIGKEHWFLLAREEDEDDDGGRVITFKIHSGQRSYIDRIGRDKDVLLAAPAANGVDIRQTAKKRMRVLMADQNDIKIGALRFSCPDDAKLDPFLFNLLESIDSALDAPTTTIEQLHQEANENLRRAFQLEVLFVAAARSA